MMYTPLNPYERYELTGMSDEEREEERYQRQEEYWNNYPDYEIDAIIEELEEIFDGDI